MKSTGIQRRRLVAFDLDGTLARYDGVNPNLSVYWEDHHLLSLLPRAPVVAKLIEAAQEPLSDIIIVSGRPYFARRTTEEWLALHLPREVRPPLHLRRMGSHLASPVEKAENLGAVLLTGRYASFVSYDDDRMVLRAYAALAVQVGVPCELWDCYFKEPRTFRDGRERGQG